MNSSRGWADRPRSMIVASAVAATLLGAGYQLAASAPAFHLITNIVALLIGLALAGGVTALRFLGARAIGPACVAIGATLLATAAFGSATEGASRWLAVGPVAVQPSLILIPVLVLAVAAAQGRMQAVGVALAAVALALQPDRAMAGALLAGMMPLALRRRDRATMIATAGTATGFAITLFRADTLPAVPFVDGIIWSAFAVHPLAGVALWSGLVALLLPAIVAVARGGEAAAAMAAFGAVWAALIAAAALGNYPTPLVGYGASAVIGYLLCGAGLPRGATRGARTGVARRDVRHSSGDTPLRRAAV